MTGCAALHRRCAARLRRPVPPPWADDDGERAHPARAPDGTSADARQRTDGFEGCAFVAGSERHHDDGGDDSHSRHGSIDAPHMRSHRDPESPSVSCMPKGAPSARTGATARGRTPPTATRMRLADDG